MKPRAFFYIWLVSLIWTVVTWISFYHPGDEYGIWAMGSLPGLWAVLVRGNQGDIHGLLMPVLGAGFLTMLIFGFVMDLLRTPRRWFLGAWLLVAVGLFVGVLVLGDRPLQRAHTPLEGVLSIGLGAINVGLSVMVLITLMGHFCLWAWRGMMRLLKWRLGAHPHPEAAKS